MGSLTFLQPNKNSKRLYSCLQTWSRVILFSESVMERLCSCRSLVPQVLQAAGYGPTNWTCLTHQWPNDWSRVSNARDRLKNLPGIKRRTKMTGFEGATPYGPHLTGHDDMSHTLQLKVLDPRTPRLPTSGQKGLPPFSSPRVDNTQPLRTRSFSTKGRSTTLGVDKPSDKDGLHTTPAHMG
jgi:hypothetical protein